MKEKIINTLLVFLLLFCINLYKLYKQEDSAKELIIKSYEESIDNIVQSYDTIISKDKKQPCVMYTKNINIYKK